LAKKDDPDTSDEVISHVNQYCCWTGNIVMLSYSSYIFCFNLTELVSKSYGCNRFKCNH
jgi:hypothetical protein